MYSLCLKINVYIVLEGLNLYKFDKYIKKLSTFIYEMCDKYH